VPSVTSEVAVKQINDKSTLYSPNSGKWQRVGKSEAIYNVKLSTKHSSLKALLKFVSFKKI
jgi:hypothetical protein